MASAEKWTLEQSLEHVRESSPDAVTAKLRIQHAEAQLREAQSKLWPRLIAETSYSATDNPPAAFMMLLNQRQLTFDREFNDPDLTDNWGSEVRLDYSIYSGGRRDAALRAASHEIDASRFMLTATRESLELNVVRAYFEISRAREVVTAAEASLRRQRSHLGLAQKLVAAKTALRSAVLDLETRVIEAEAKLVFAEHVRENHIAHLKSLLGIEGDVAFSIAQIDESLPHPGGTSGTTRPELLMLRERAKAAAAGIDQAKSGARPQVGAFVSARHDEGFQEADGGNSWVAGISVRLDIWDGGETKAKVKQAQVEEAIAREAERKQRLEIERQTRAARLAVTAASKRKQLSDAGIRSATESLSLIQKRFEEGLALSTELIDAETALTSSVVARANAIAEEQIAIASLRHALGLPIRPSYQSSRSEE